MWQLCQLQEQVSWVWHRQQQCENHMSSTVTILSPGHTESVENLSGGHYFARSWAVTVGDLGLSTHDAC